MESHLENFNLISDQEDLLTPTQGWVCEHAGRFILETERGKQPRCSWTPKYVRNIHKAGHYSDHKGCGTVRYNMADSQCVSQGSAVQTVWPQQD